MNDNENFLKGYIESWNKIDGVKPTNNPEFIKHFLGYLNEVNSVEDIEFDGEGAYFGKQFVFRKDNLMSFKPSVGFEVAYSKDTIRVYTDKHSGYWVPEYIVLKKDDEMFDTVLSLIMRKLTEMISV